MTSQISKESLSNSINTTINMASATRTFQNAIAIQTSWKVYVTLASQYPSATSALQNASAMYWAVREETFLNVGTSCVAESIPDMLSATGVFDDVALHWERP
ncbi:hypothetical protein Csa_009358 [Cucumis sativus]|uniref:Uncharacterized protein n=1 Tax=Cucumis sativus TaxID=3659 RepID=A0A0A0KN40_CUCSA|nr:hypothetical protein Csa_009358 [Cucumis sativus]